MQLAAINRDQAATIVAVLGAVATARGTQPVIGCRPRGDPGRGP